jgi:hypothetical protein
LLFKLAREDVHCGLRLREADPGLEPPDDMYIVVGAIRMPGSQRRIQHQRRPQLSARRKLEAWRHDAHDRIVLAAQLNLAANQLRISAEASFPQPIAQNCDTMTPSLFFFGQKIPTERGRRS